MDKKIDYASELQQLDRVFAEPMISGNLRTKPEDFKVTEELNFSPSGYGEHLFIKLQKTNANTQWVIKQLGKTFELSSKQIGYAGKKDRHSVSIQWFSLHLPGKDVDLDKLDIDGVELVEFVRHNKKLKIGSLKYNQFEITLRRVSGEINREHIKAVSACGVPNYFGAQRFGHNASNLELANEYLNQKCKIKNRDKRGIVISSARSFLFNLILSERVKLQNWNAPINGDCLSLNGSQSFFCLDSNDGKRDRSPSPDVAVKFDETRARIATGDLHISGLLPGREKSDAVENAKLVEDGVLTQYPNWMLAFYRLNLSTARRSLRVIPQNLYIKQENEIVRMCFKLGKGSYATSVIRELVNVNDVSLRENN